MQRIQEQRNALQMDLGPAVSTLLVLTIPPNPRKMEAADYLDSQLKWTANHVINRLRQRIPERQAYVLSDDSWILHGFQGRIACTGQEQ